MKLKSSKELKSSAKKHLTDCWGESVAIVLIIAGIITAICVSFLTVINFLYSYNLIEYNIDNIFIVGGWKFYSVAAAVVLFIRIMLIPLEYGMCWYYMQTAQGKNVPASCFFSCYMNGRKFRKTLATGITVMLYKSLIALPAFIIGYIEIRLAKAALHSPHGTPFYTVVVCCLILLLTCMIFFYIVLTIKFLLVPSLFALNPDRKVKQLIKQSKDILYGRESYIIEVYFSFAGWLASCILIFPMVFVIPYLCMTNGEAALMFIDNYKSEQNSIRSLKKTSGLYDNSKKEDNILV